MLELFPALIDAVATAFALASYGVIAFVVIVAVCVLKELAS